jgi:hypothetical protein
MFKKIVAVMVLVMFTIASLGCGGVTKSAPGDAPKLARIIDKDKLWVAGLLVYVRGLLIGRAPPSGFGGRVL